MVDSKKMTRLFRALKAEESNARARLYIKRYMIEKIESLLSCVQDSETAFMMTIAFYDRWVEFSTLNTEFEEGECVSLFVSLLKNGAIPGRECEKGVSSAIALLLSKS